MFCCCYSTMSKFQYFESYLDDNDFHYIVSRNFFYEKLIVPSANIIIIKYPINPCFYVYKNNKYLIPMYTTVNEELYNKIVLLFIFSTNIENKYRMIRTTTNK